MNTQNRALILDIYTGHYVDNEMKEKNGAAFAAVMVRGDRDVKKEHTLYGQDDTYMTIWLKGVAQTLSQVLEAAEAAAGWDERRTVNVTIHVRHNNVAKIASKLRSVFEDIKGFERATADRLLDRKLRRSDRSRYPNEELHKNLLSVMLDLHAVCDFKIKFKPGMSTKGDVGTAYQLAQIALDEAHAASSGQNNVVAFRIGAI